MSSQDEHWYETAYDRTVEWFQKPEVRKVLATAGLVIGVMGFVMFSVFKDEDRPNNQIQAIAEGIILAGQRMFMPWEARKKRSQPKHIFYYFIWNFPYLSNFK